MAPSRLETDMEEHKAERLKNLALENGWKADLIVNTARYEQTGDPHTVEWNIYAIRDKESIHALYQGNRFMLSTYSYGGRKNYPARSGAVARLLQGKPDPES